MAVQTPLWQSPEKHRRLKIMMQDVPHLIQSELAGLAFSSLQSIFRKVDIKIALTLPILAHIEYNKIYVTIDPVNLYAIFKCIFFQHAFNYYIPFFFSPSFSFFSNGMYAIPKFISFWRTSAWFFWDFRLFFRSR